MSDLGKMGIEYFKKEEKMNFVIQASNPIVLGEYSAEDKDISEAIETIFPMDTECAILRWNYISVPLSYKYDISYMIIDILNLLEQLQTRQQGIMIIHWLPDTFRVDWKVTWKDKQLTVKSHWENVVGGFEELLNEKAEVAIKIDEFLCEWKQLLYILICALETSGYNEKLYGMKQLKDQFKKISGSGILYSSVYNF